jgi:hypothetical protein
VSETDQLIADALRGLAEQAAPPRQTAAAAWRAGRRRRATARSATAAGAAAAVTAAVVVPLAAATGPAHPSPAGVAGTGPMTLASPIQFRQVASYSSGPCPAHSSGVPGVHPPACFHLTGPTVTLTRLDSLRLTTGQCAPRYELDFTLTPADRGPVAALTGKLARVYAGTAAGPRSQLAIIIDGRVIAHPVTQGEITRNGQISCLGHAEAGQLLQSLRGG